MSDITTQFEYWYRATLVRVLDGDTCEVVLDYGRRLVQTEIVRWYGINAYELNDKDPAKRELAKQGREYVISRFPTTLRGLVVQTFLDKDDKYGRLLADFYVYGEPRGISVNQELVDKGLAVVATY